MYFKQFPKMLYSFDLAGSSPALVTNVFSRFKIDSNISDNAVAFYKYQYKEGDTPELVAYSEYGDPTLHWIISMINKINDPLFEYPLATSALEEKIIKKYNYPSIANAYAEIHHYVYEVESTVSEVQGATTVTTTNNIVTLQQYSYVANTLTLNVTGSPTYANAVFRANNSNANTAVTSTVSVKSTYYPVYVYDYETDLNEKNRQIKILKPEYVAPLLLELETVLNG